MVGKSDTLLVLSVLNKLVTELLFFLWYMYLLLLYQLQKNVGWGSCYSLWLVTIGYNCQPKALLYNFIYKCTYTVCAKNILTNKPEQHFIIIFSIWLSKFYAIFTSPNQFLLDRGIQLVVFGADCIYIYISTI